MATWEELRTYLASKYTIETDTGNTIRIVFDTKKGRSHAISVHNFDPLVTFSAPFAYVGQGAIDEILERTIPFGVARIGDVYTIIHTTWLATLDELEVEGPIHILVSKADELEEKITGKDRF